MKIDFSGLNPSQKEAVETLAGPLLVLAGAGTGKTRVITYRIANLLKNWVAPENILALTFTNKSAREMRERIQNLVGKERAKKIFLGTFHAFCIRILRYEVTNTSLHNGFTIADDVDQKSILKQAVGELGFASEKVDINIYRTVISNAKNEVLFPEDYKRKATGFFENQIGRIYTKYQEILQVQNMVDFDDILIMVVRLWETHPNVLKKYQEIYKYILVDEFQDTNQSQFRVIELLAGEKKNICVVGDDDQCVPKGTQISCFEGKSSNIESIRKDEAILTASGNSETMAGTVEKTISKQYSGPLIKITTKSGKSISATPNHIGFIKLNPEPGKFYVYLMCKKGKGYRIGQTQGVRSRKGEIVNGLKVRLNQEHADKVWILKTCTNIAETSYFEQYFAFKYGIPTTVFCASGRNISMSQDYLDKLFQNIDTETAAIKLLQDNNLFEEYPHCLPNAVVRAGSTRRIINITAFGGRKTGKESGWHSHRISLNTSGNDLKDLLIQKEFPVRNGQRSTWRVETERAEYDEASLYAEKLCHINNDLQIVKKSKLVKDQNSFMYMPFSHMRPNMSIPVLKNNCVVEDIITKVEYEEYEGTVYDLSIPHLRQYIANGIVIHNSIYGWRGAKVENILNFPQHFKGAKVVKLEQNYRSTNTILKAANSFISGNTKRHEKVLWSKRGEGQKIKIHQTSSDVNEPVFVANEIYRIMLSNSSIKYKDIAILYRSNHQSRLFEQQLRYDNIPYRLVGSKSFYDRREIRDAIAYVKLIANPRDDQSFLRIIGVPSRGLGLKAIAQLREIQSRKNLPLCNILEDSEFLSSVSGKGKSSSKEFSTHFNYWSNDFTQPGNLSFKVQNYFLDIGFLNGFQKMYKNSDEADSRRDNVLELINAIAQFENISSEEKTLVDFLESFSLSDDNDKVDEDEENNNNSVTLLTVHAAKGLEFPHVFIVGMEQNIFPHSRALEGRDIDEERRLFYVAVTRAKDGLVLTHSKTRFKYGKKEYQLRSDFLDELPEELLEEHSAGPAVEDDIVENAFSDFYDQFSIE